MHETARSLRSAERFLVTPPLAATFDAAPVAVCDLSAKGARFRHAIPVDAGSKGNLRISSSATRPQSAFEAVVAWTQPDGSSPGQFVSGVRAYGAPGAMESILEQLMSDRRAQRIEELRTSERFVVLPPIAAEYDRAPARIEDLSARGARLALPFEPLTGSVATLRFHVPQSDLDIVVAGQVAWSALRSVSPGETMLYRAGVLVEEKPELMRLAIGRLGESGRASLDPHSLGLKLRILRARARQLAPSCHQIEGSGIPAEVFLLVQGVREELRLNPEEAAHWYRRARLLIRDPGTSRVAHPIASHPDALAVWEYLERSVDPSIVGRVFAL